MGVTLDRFKKTFNKKVSDDLLKNRQDKVREALKELKTAVETLTAIGASPDPYTGRLLNLATRFNNINKQPSGNEEIYADLETIKEEARTEAAKAGKAALAAPEANTAEKKLLVQGRCGDAKAGSLRAQAETAQKSDPKFLEKLADMPGGTAILDEMVADLKGTAGNAASQDFVKQAMLARFKMKKLEGDLNKKSLPHLYKVLAMVPESHARNNPRLAEITMKVGGGGGDYTGGKLALNCLLDDRDSFWADQFQCDPADGMDPAWQAKGDDHHRFDSTTLHEIGHAVDDDTRFMEKHAKNDAFGGWEKLNLDDFARYVGTKFNFFAKWNKYPVHMLHRLVKDALSGSIDQKGWAAEKRKADEGPTREALLDDAGVKAAEAKRLEWEQQRSGTDDEKEKAFNSIRSALKGLQRLVGNEVIQMIITQDLKAADAVDQKLAELRTVGDPPVTDDWEAMGSDPMMTWCKLARTGDSWKLGAAHAQAVAKVDGNCYTHDKQGWYKYSPAARKKAISKYQFNTPAEWFAELYAAYYLKKLPTAHPDYKWMNDEIHNRK